MKYVTQMVPCMKVKLRFEATCNEIERIGFYGKVHRAERRLHGRGRNAIITEDEKCWGRGDKNGSAELEKEGGGNGGKEPSKYSSSTSRFARDMQSRAGGVC